MERQGGPRLESLNDDSNLWGKGKIPLEKPQTSASHWYYHPPKFTGITLSGSKAEILGSLDWGLLPSAVRRSIDELTPICHTQQILPTILPHGVSWCKRPSSNWFSEQPDFWWVRVSATHNQEQPCVCVAWQSVVQQPLHTQGHLSWVAAVLCQWAPFLMVVAVDSFSDGWRVFLIIAIMNQFKIDFPGLEASQLNTGIHSVQHVLNDIWIGFCQFLRLVIFSLQLPSNLRAIKKKKTFVFEISVEN